MFARLTALVRDYFGFSTTEARGFWALLLLLVLLLLTPFLYRRFATTTRPDTTATDQRKLDSLVALMKTEDVRQEAGRQNQYGNRYGSSRADNRDHGAAEHFREPKLFRFDPNTVSVAGWQQLGLPRYMAERIDKYRSKGGQFRRKEDLLKIYDFPPDLYDQLEPYITLPAKAGSPPGDRYADRQPNDARSAGSFPVAGASTGSRPERPVYTKPVIQPFDINTADTTELKQLRGIGSTLARRIVKYRDALGGFVASEQFAEIYGLDSLALSELQQYGQIRSAPRQVNANTATAEELDRLPFLSRRQAEIIVNYRQQHGAYTSAESLRPIRVLDARTVEKLGLYLSF